MSSGMSSGNDVLAPSGNDVTPPFRVITSSRSSNFENEIHELEKNG
jgi:hypothetical protein